MTLKNNNVFVVLLMLIGIVVLSSCSNEEPLELDYVFESSINPKQSIDDFSDIKFEPFETLDLGFLKGDVWIKLEIKNTENKASYMVITNDFFNHNYRFYKLNQEDQTLFSISNTKDLAKQDHRTFNDLKPNFKIDLEPNEVATYIFTTKSDGRIIQATPSLQKIDDYKSAAKQTTIFNIIFFISIIVLLIINIFNWSVFKENIYYFYCFYILSTCLFYLNVEGFLNGVVSYQLVDHAVFLSIRIWIVSVAMFSSRFLDLSTTNPKFHKTVKIFLIIIVGGSTCYQLVFFNSSIANLHFIENVFGLFWVMIALVMIALSLKKIPLQAKYYLLAFSFLVVFLIIGLVNSHFPVLPGDPFSYFKVGMIIEFIGFTYFIALLIKRNLKKTSELESELIANKKELSEVSKKLETKLDKTDLLGIFKLLESSFNKEEWPIFKSRFEELSPNFLSQLNKDHPDLSKSEIRLLTLIRIGFTQKEIAEVLSIAPDSAKKAKQRVRKKLGLARSLNLADYLSSLN